MIHRHYETFELPEVPDRHAPDGLDIQRRIFMTAT
jgi:hypothetical protein